MTGRLGFGFVLIAFNACLKLGMNSRNWTGNPADQQSFDDSQSRVLFVFRVTATRRHAVDCYLHKNATHPSFYASTRVRNHVLTRRAHAKLGT